MQLNKKIKKLRILFLISQLVPDPEIQTFFPKMTRHIKLGQSGRFF